MPPRRALAATAVITRRPPAAGAAGSSELVGIYSMVKLWSSTGTMLMPT